MMDRSNLSIEDTVIIDIKDASQDIIPIGKIKQYNDLHIIHFNIIKDGEPLDLTGKTVRVYGEKPDGSIIFNNLKIINNEEGTVDYEVTDNALASKGLLRIELSIYEGKNVIATKILLIRVENTLRNDDAIESTNEFGAFVNEIDRLEKKVDEMVVEASPVQSVNGKIGDVQLNADDIPFNDGETFQQKLDTGKLKGQDGKDGLPGEKGERGEKGEQGIPGEKGADGKNGKDGQPGKNGAPGKNGVDGISPVVDIQEGDKTHTITITDKTGSHQTIVKDGKDGARGLQGEQGLPGKKGADGSPGAKGDQGEKGFSPKVSITESKGVHTVTITDELGEHKTVIKDGKNGTDGEQGLPGENGKNGEDGYSPTVETKEGDKQHTIIITDKVGTHQVVVKDGKDGEKGAPGEKGQNGLPGEKGADGAPGKDAVINGVNTLKIEQGENISIQQSENTLTISAIVGGKSVVESVNGKIGKVVLGADDIAFTDGETFQDKLDTGKLKGQDGKNGVDGQQGERGQDGKDGEPGTPGEDGFSPTVSMSEGDKIHTITITDKMGEHKTIVKDGIDGSEGPRGHKGEPGAKGEDGFSPIVEIQEGEGTHTISITDSIGTKNTIVKDGKDGTNGQDGAPGENGADGKPGVDGKDGLTTNINIDKQLLTQVDGTITVPIESIDTNTIDTIIKPLIPESPKTKPSNYWNKDQSDQRYVKRSEYVPGEGGGGTLPGVDGYSPIVEIVEGEGTHTINITDKEGTKTTTIKDGKDGAKGQDGANGTPGKDGQDGAKGQDGVSPIVAIQEGDKQHTISITDSTGTKTTVVKDGKDGTPGKDGKPNPNADSVNGLKFWTGTKSEYSALSSHDANTVYLIKEG